MKFKQHKAKLYAGAVILLACGFMFRISAESRTENSFRFDKRLEQFQTNTSSNKRKKTVKERKMNEKKSNEMPSGIWAGDGINLFIEKSTAKIEFDCGEGEISQKMSVDEKSFFSLKGFYSARYPGALRVNLPPKRQAARYEGKITGMQINLRIISEESGEIIRETVLKKTKAAKIRKCF